MSGPVVLQVPSDPAMSRVARLTSSALAALAKMSIDDIDDVKIVVSEVMAALVEHGDGADITLRFDVGEGEITVTGYTKASTFTAGGGDMALSATVLSAIAKEHSIEHHDGELLITAVYAAAPV